MNRKPPSPDIPSRGSAPLSGRVRKPAQFWSDSKCWPKGDRETVFAGTAVQEIGKAMFGERWTSREVESMSATAGGEEVSRLDTAIEAIVEQARLGLLVTLLRRKDTVAGGGEYAKAPSSLWNVEQIRQTRFLPGHFTYRPAAGFRMVDVYAFFTRQSLDTCKAVLAAAPIGAHPEADGLHFSPYLKLMFAVIREKQITPDNQGKKADIQDAFVRLAPQFGIDVQSFATMSGYLASAVREPESQAGRAAKKGQTQ